MSAARCLLAALEPQQALHHVTHAHKLTGPMLLPQAAELRPPSTVQLLMQRATSAAAGLASGLAKLAVAAVVVAAMVRPSRSMLDADRQAAAAPAAASTLVLGAPQQQVSGLGSKGRPRVVLQPVADLAAEDLEEICAAVLQQLPQPLWLPWPELQPPQELPGGELQPALFQVRVPPAGSHAAMRDGCVAVQPCAGTCCAQQLLCVCAQDPS